MATPPVTDSELRQSMTEILKFGGCAQAAVATSRQSAVTYRRHKRLAKQRGLSANDTPPTDFPDRPRVRVKASEGLHRVLAIGDAHDDPRLDKERFKWFGRLAAESRPDAIVQIGDWATLDSLNTFEANDTIAGQAKPSFAEDLASLEESIAAFNRQLPGGYKPRRVITKGNHEYRADRFENKNPELKEFFALQIDQAFLREGWEVKPYGDFLFIGGVGFTHAPHNQMGKPYGGKFPENQIGNDAVFSVVFGHTHKKSSRTFPKIGPNRQIQVINLGSALPDGHVETYAAKSTVGWSYGVFELLIGGGQVVADRFISMQELGARYGKK